MIIIVVIIMIMIMIIILPILVIISMSQTRGSGDWGLLRLAVVLSHPASKARGDVCESGRCKARTGGRTRVGRGPSAEKDIFRFQDQDMLRPQVTRCPIGKSRMFNT